MILKTILLVGAISVMIAVPRGADAAQHPDIPNLMLKPSVNLVLSVGDVEKSKDFYGQVLAFEANVQPEPAGRAHNDSLSGGRHGD